MPGPAQKGYLAMVLHAHLPFVRHPEHEFFLEENWLFEAMTESYIPLCETFRRLLDDGIEFRISLSLSPPLLEMLDDELLMGRYLKHIHRLLALTDAEVSRTKKDARLGPVAKMYQRRLGEIKYLFEDVFKRRLVPVFSGLRDSGRVEILTCAATHAFLPNLFRQPQAVKAQLRVAAAQYRRIFGDAPAGIWLPECGFVPGLDSLLSEEGIRFFFLESHGLTAGNPPPRHGVYAPIECPSGVKAFGRDEETSRQVWSSAEGYPGDPCYRDFYRDAGFDVDEDHMQSFLKPYCAKTFTGLKYFRITGEKGPKRPYILRRAMERAEVHAGHFLGQREIQIARLSNQCRTKPVVVASYDAELFGHWWFEGPEWLERFFRKLHVMKTNFAVITPSEYLARHPRSELCIPSLSSWGERGYGHVWLNESNDYMQPHLFRTVERMQRLTNLFPKASGVLRRTLNQAARELLLAQHSDWAFMLTNGGVSAYGARRFREHIGRFNLLYEAATTGSGINHLPEIEERDNIFQWMNFTVYSEQAEREACQTDRL